MKGSKSENETQLLCQSLLGTSYVPFSVSLCPKDSKSRLFVYGFPSQFKATQSLMKGSKSENETQLLCQSLLGTSYVPFSVSLCPKDSKSRLFVYGFSSQFKATQSL